MLGIIAALAMFCVLVVFHEGGHFLMAKAVNIKVNEFAVGMGPILLKKQKGETLYSFRALPIGGFCSMETSENEEEILPRSFEAAKPIHRAMVLLAGPFMNLAVAVLIMAAVTFYIGLPTAEIGAFSKESLAGKAGLEIEDKIVAIEGEKVEKWSDVSAIISTKASDVIKIDVERKSEKLSFDVPLIVDEESGRKMIGITPHMHRDPGKSLVYGAKASYDITVGMIKTLGQLFTGQVSPKDFTGVVGITVVVGNTIDYGFIYFAQFAALISINLGIVNLLPFPALDGGRLVMLAIRQITGKVITDEMESKIHFVGIIALFALMIYVTWQDIGRFILK